MKGDGVRKIIQQRCTFQSSHDFPWIPKKTSSCMIFPFVEHQMTMIHQPPLKIRQSNQIRLQLARVYSRYIYSLLLLHDNLVPQDGFSTSEDSVFWRWPVSALSLYTSTRCSWCALNSDAFVREYIHANVLNLFSIYISHCSLYRSTV